MTTDETYLICADIHSLVCPSPGEPMPCIDCGAMLWRAFSSPTGPQVVCMPCAALRRREAGEDSTLELTERSRAALRKRGWTDAEIDEANAAADAMIHELSYRRDN